jgi:uncharacterized protein YmfQ (DUF2313 family)
MPLISYSAEDYLTGFQRLLPRGRVWNRGLELIQDFDLLVLMPTWVRLQDALNSLIADIFPCTTTDLLPEWEETLGLPSECTGNLGTLQERQQAVCVKFTARGGQSMAYFTAIAETLGYSITITEFAPFRAGINRAGDPVYGAGWAYVWQITAAGPMIYFRAGLSTAGEPLRSWGSRLFECTMDEIKPAHTVLLFGYTQPLEAAHDRRNPDLGPPDRRRMEPGHRGPVRTSLPRRRAADRQDPRPGDGRIGR